jgi:hypothetical protein
MIYSISGSTRQKWSDGKTSATPPTSVDTTYIPDDIASRLARQNASVIDRFRNISPLVNTCGT